MFFTHQTVYLESKTASQEAVLRFLLLPRRNRTQIRLQQRIHLLQRLAHEQHRVEGINRLRDSCDGLDIERRDDDLAAEDALLLDPQTLVQRQHHIPARVSGGHLSFLMKRVHPVNDAE